VLVWVELSDHRRRRVDPVGVRENPLQVLIRDRGKASEPGERLAQEAMLRGNACSPGRTGRPRRCDVGAVGAKRRAPAQVALTVTLDERPWIPHVAVFPYLVEEEVDGRLLRRERAIGRLEAHVGVAKLLQLRRRRVVEKLGQCAVEIVEHSSLGSDSLAAHAGQSGSWMFGLT